jgi:hypothetical protein
MGVTAYSSVCMVLLHLACTLDMSAIPSLDILASTISVSMQADVCICDVQHSRFHMLRCVTTKATGEIS